MLVVKSKIKEHCEGLNVSSDFADALDKEAEHMIKRACERCKANGRKTVSAKDI